MAFASVLAICNQSDTSATVRVAVRPAGIAATAKTYLIYDTPIGSSDTLNLTLGLSLGPTDIVSVSSSHTAVSTILSGSELVIDASTVLSVYNIATSSSVGMVRPDNTSIVVYNGILSVLPFGSLPVATSSTLGAVTPDGTSILVTSGVISANIRVATSSAIGTVRPDGTSILVTSGVISANIQVATSSAIGTVRPDNSSLVVNNGVMSLGSSLTTSWTFQQSSNGSLIFYYGGAARLSIDSSGTLTALGNVRAFTTPA